MPEPVPNDDVLANVSRLLALINAQWTSQATRVAAELGIADLLRDGPRTAADLAEATGTHAPSLHRLLRALVTIELIAEREDGAFEATPMGRLLRSDAESTVRSWAIYQGRDVWDEWGLMLEAVTTGKSGREIANGKPSFEPLSDDAQRAATFNQAMAELTRISARTIVAGYDFGGLSRIADIGGGYGELLGAVLTTNPEATGILFDLPHAIENARPHLEKCGVLDRCDVISGSFFDEVPAGADAYLLKSVVHDWDDERGRQILRNVRGVMGLSAKLLLVERLMPERMLPGQAHQAYARSDLNMLVAHAAPERTERQWRDLLGSAGFEIGSITGLARDLNVIEAMPSA